MGVVPSQSSAKDFNKSLCGSSFATDRDNNLQMCCHNSTNDLTKEYEFSESSTCSKSFRIMNCKEKHSNLKIFCPLGNITNKTLDNLPKSIPPTLSNLEFPPPPPDLPPSSLEIHFQNDLNFLSPFLLFAEKNAKGKFHSSKRSPLTFMNDFKKVIEKDNDSEFSELNAKNLGNQNHNKTPEPQANNETLTVKEITEQFQSHCLVKKISNFKRVENEALKSPQQDLAIPETAVTDFSSKSKKLAPNVLKKNKSHDMVPKMSETATETDFVDDLKSKLKRFNHQSEDKRKPNKIVDKATSPLDYAIPNVSKKNSFNQKNSSCKSNSFVSNEKIRQNFSEISNLLESCNSATNWLQVAEKIRLSCANGASFLQDNDSIVPHEKFYFRDLLSKLEAQAQQIALIETKGKEEKAKLLNDVQKTVMCINNAIQRD